MFQLSEESSLEQKSESRTTASFNSSLDWRLCCLETRGYSECVNALFLPWNITISLAFVMKATDSRPQKGTLSRPSAGYGRSPLKEQHVWHLLCQHLEFWWLCVAFVLQHWCFLQCQWIVVPAEQHLALIHSASHSLHCSLSDKVTPHVLGVMSFYITTQHYSTFEWCMAPLFRRWTNHDSRLWSTHPSVMWIIQSMQTPSYQAEHLQTKSTEYMHM